MRPRADLRIQSADDSGCRHCAGRGAQSPSPQPNQPQNHPSRDSLLARTMMAPPFSGNDSQEIVGRHIGDEADRGQGAHDPDRPPARILHRGSGWGALEWTGVGLAGAGAVSLAVGGYFLSAALGNKSESEDDCEGNLCGPRGYERREQAVSEGNTATILGIAGGALLAGGARCRGRRVPAPARLAGGILDGG